MTIFFTSMETPDASTARWTIRKRPEQVLVKAPQGEGRAVGRDEQVAPLEVRGERKSPSPLTCFPFFCYNGPDS
jgi:hypothetical protein